MARKTVVQLSDDLDGSTGPGIQTHKFSFLGADYEVDLGPDNAQAMADALEPYVIAGRRVGGRLRQPTLITTASGRSREQTKDMRAWLRAEGHILADRGRIPQNLVDLYERRTEIAGKTTKTAKTKPSAKSARQ